MSQQYSRSLLRIAVAQICQNLGWHSAQSSSLEVLTDVLERYLTKIGTTCHNYSEHCGRTQPNLDDLAVTFQQMGISLAELEDYVRHVDPVPFAHEVIAFPAPKSNNLGFPNPRSREILHHREEHIDDHLPHMFPNMRDEVPEERPASPITINDTPVKMEQSDNETKSAEESQPEKRPLPNSSPEGPPIKRQRLGNSNLPEEAGHSQYEMTSVFMGPNGVLTTRQGYQGKKPEPRLPPPNPYTLPEGKENSAKSKDSNSGTKISITVGGSEPTIVGKSSGKSSKKLKEGKELGKKSSSSKAAAKYLNKLIKSKSSKVFDKSKLKELKQSDGHKGKKLPGLNGEIKVKEGKKSKKVKKSASIVDSDEELRNLCSPSSSRELSPEHDTINDSDGKKAARLDAINDSINSVLRDGPGKPGRPKKKKGSSDKKDNVPTENGDFTKPEGDGKGKEKKLKKKVGKKSKDKVPEASAAPVDIKPFVSDKYSSEELQVYEFNDSPPDNSVKARRPSAPSSPPPSVPTPPPPPPPPPPPKAEKPHSSKHSSGHKAHKYPKQPEEELFAPEIKFESVKHDDKKSKSDKDKKKSEDSKVLSKGKEDKSEKSKGKKDKLKDVKDKIKEDKESKKQKEHHKDKKEKRKEKDKKKKHKEKEKKREEKVKQESAHTSRESSPAVGGVRLTIKIGGSTGAVVMDSPAPSPVPSTGSKRESMSPPRTVPKLLISKKGSQEEKTKKSTSKNLDGGSGGGSKHKSSVSPHTREPTPPAPRKTPTPPPPARRGKKSVSPLSRKEGGSELHHKKSSSGSSAKERQGRTFTKRSQQKKKEKKTVSLSSLSSSSSLSPSPVAKSRQTPPKLKRMSSSSPEKSPPSLPAQSPTPSPRPPSRTVKRSPSVHRSPTPPSLLRRKPTPPPSLSPAAAAARNQRRSPSPMKPPTPGSTSPPASPEWNLPVSPAPHRSPTPTPRTPTASPSRHASPTHSSPSASPQPHRSPTPPTVRPSSRQVTTPLENKSLRDSPSPALSSKSSSSLSKSSTVVAETVCVFYDDKGQKVWICPACKLQDDGSEMIGCDLCDNWYHWPCVNITKEPPEEQKWFCPSCLPKSSSRGRGRPRGRGRGRGRKKIT